MGVRVDGPCDSPVPFSQSLDICDNCGRQLAEHKTRPVAAQGFQAAMWRVLLAGGGLWTTYGVSEWASERQRKHLKSCGIDWHKTSDVQMNTRSAFDGTDADSVRVDMVSGDLWCLCGEIRYATWAWPDVALGQLIWLAARVDDDLSGS